MNIGKTLLFVMVVAIVGLINACAKDKEPVISFSKDVQPILSANCLECHAQGGQGQVASGLNMETYADLMKGTKFGPVIKAGDSLSSTLIVLIEGRADPSINMPHGDRAPLSKEQISTLKKWINQGAANN